MFCQNPDYIDWNGADYPIKTVVIFENTPDEEKVTVSIERLARQLLDDMGNWSTREAESVDEQIYFYLDEETFNMPDEDIVEYLKNNEITLYRFILWCRWNQHRGRKSPFRERTMR